MASERARHATERTTQLVREWLEDAPSKWFKSRAKSEQTGPSGGRRGDCVGAFGARARLIAACAREAGGRRGADLRRGSEWSARREGRVWATIKGEPSPVVLPRREFWSILRRHPDVLYSWRVQEMLQAVLLWDRHELVRTEHGRPSVRAVMKALDRRAATGPGSVPAGAYTRKRYALDRRPGPRKPQGSRPSRMRRT